MAIAVADCLGLEILNILYDNDQAIHDGPVAISDVSRN